MLFEYILEKRTPMGDSEGNKTVTRLPNNEDERSPKVSSRWKSRKRESHTLDYAILCDPLTACASL